METPHVCGTCGDVSRGWGSLWSTLGRLPDGAEETGKCSWPCRPSPGLDLNPKSGLPGRVNNPQAPLPTWPGWTPAAGTAAQGLAPRASLGSCGISWPAHRLDVTPTRFSLVPPKLAWRTVLSGAQGGLESDSGVSVWDLEKMVITFFLYY